MNEDIIYFISDQHIGSGRNEKEKLERLFSFFDYIINKKCSLYIVGDFFDFFFEYKTQMPKKYFEVFRRLSGLADRGIKISYFTGNHDFWVGDFLESVGVSLYRKGKVFNLQGKNVYISHNVLPMTILDIVLRNRVFISSFYLIHPDIAYTIASLVSRASRANSMRKVIKWDRIYRKARELLKGDVDAVVLGHIHIPFYKKIKEKDFIIIGDWIKHFSYVTMIEGKLSLHRWE